MQERENEYLKGFDIQRQRIEELELNLHQKDTKYEKTQRTVQDLEKNNKCLNVQLGALHSKLEIQEINYMKLIQQSKEKDQEQQCTIHDLKKSIKSLTVQLDALQCELKSKESNYMNLNQQKDKKHQEQQRTIHDLEESNNCLKVNLSDSQSELQHKEKLLETRQARIQELEHHLLQSENECRDHLRQIEGRKVQFIHQKQCIRDLKMQLKLLRKCCCNNPFSDDWEDSLNDEGSTDNTRRNQQEMDTCDFNETCEGSTPGQKSKESTKTLSFQTDEGDRSTDAPPHMRNVDMDKKEYDVHDESTTQVSTTETVQNQQQSTDDINGEERVDHDNFRVEERNHEGAQLDVGVYYEYEATVHQPEVTFYMQTNGGQGEEKNDEKPQAEVEEFVEEPQADTVLNEHKTNGATQDDRPIDMIDEEQQQETAQQNMPTDDGQVEEKNDEKPQAEIKDFLRRDSTVKIQHAGTQDNDFETNHAGNNHPSEMMNVEIEDFVELDSTGETQRSGNIRSGLETNHAENNTPLDMINVEITWSSPTKASFHKSSQIEKMEEQCTKNQNRKRKSDVIGDSQHEHSNKKLRKSARLQEKRLAKQKKD
jgi:hypothetical protein